MNSTDLSLLLPPSDAGATLFLTQSVDSSRHLSASSASEGNGPFAAIVRLPGGPRPSDQLMKQISGCLLDSGILMWLTSPVESNRRVRHFLARFSSSLITYRRLGPALVDTDSAWAKPLVRSGKLEKILDALPLRLRSLTSQTVSVAVLREAIFPGWCHKLLESIDELHAERSDSRSIGMLQTMSTGLVICQIGNERPLWVLKVPSTAFARSELNEQNQILRSLAADTRIPERLGHAIPQIIAHGEFRRRPFSIENAIPGVSAQTLMYRRHEREALIDKAVEWLSDFHTVTRSMPLDIEKEIAAAATILPKVTSISFTDKTVSFLRESLEELNLPAIHSHGDFWIGNLMFNQSSGQLTGVLDWGGARQHAPPLGDLLNLLCARKDILTTYDHGRYLTKMWQSSIPDRDIHRIHSYLAALELSPSCLLPLSILFWSRFLDTWKDFGSAAWYRRLLTGPRNHLENTKDWGNLADDMVAKLRLFRS